MTNITNAELTQMKERAEKATVGPWGNGEQYEQMDPGHYVYSETSGLIVVAEEEGTFRGEDATFIAHARQDVPRLVAEVERQQGEIYRLRYEAEKAYEYLFEVYGLSATDDHKITFALTHIRNALSGGESE